MPVQVVARNDLSVMPDTDPDMLVPPEILQIRQSDDQPVRSDKVGKFGAVCEARLQRRIHVGEGSHGPAACSHRTFNMNGRYRSCFWHEWRLHG